MMNSSFCAEESRMAGVYLIGSARTHQTYVLVECPTPWATSAFDSKSVPSNFRALIEEYKQTQQLVRPLLIYNNQLKQDNYTRVLILRKKEGLSDGYSKQEFNVRDVSDVAPLVRECLAGNYLSDEHADSQTREILVCTHGRRDKCCAKYGNPFYRQALATVSNLSLSNVRIWQASHIGGHRFAPTAIDFPEGRYYGWLDSLSFTSILTRTGDIRCLNQVYRGWGILPQVAQVLERELLLAHGWDWFSCKVVCQILEQNEDQSFNHIELTFERPDGANGSYRADVVADESKTVYLRGACGITKDSKITPFSVKNLVRI